MEIQLLCVGKTDRSFWSNAIEEYEKRLMHYVKFSIQFVSEPKARKKINPQQIKEQEAQLILQKIKPYDQVILLDEKGESYSSKKFSQEINRYLLSGKKRIVFVVGGAYGFSDLLYQKFSITLRLSDMTFSHQMVRLFFCEQLYRAFTILNNHPYHNH
jgi:23S rRNA (pseudouridine1915-N3)-methyltransferase